MDKLERIEKETEITYLSDWDGRKKEYVVLSPDDFNWLVSKAKKPQEIDEAAALEKAREVNSVMTDITLTVNERKSYIDTLSDAEIRGIMKQLMTAYAAKAESRVD